MTPIRRYGAAATAVLALALLGASPALGATHIWTGPTNGLWSSAGNWSGGKPTSGEIGGTIVQFTSNSTSMMDIAGLAVDQIDFTGSGNTINGSQTLTISGSTLVQNLVSSAAQNTLSSSLPITISGASVEATSAAGTLTIAGAIGGTVGMVFIGGVGAFDLTGDNTYTGATAINSGEVRIGTNAGYVIDGSSLTIGNGQGSGAQLLLDNSSDISPHTTVTVNSDGVFDFQSHLDTAASLTVSGGQVLGANLTMTGPLVMNGGLVTLGPGNLQAASLSMTGGTISGTSTGLLVLAGNIQATSSPVFGPAIVASGVRLTASPTVTVSPGTAPEFWVTGVISETGGSQSITKLGTGTMLTTANNTYTGTTAVSAGTLAANGSQTGPFSIGQGGTLSGSGTLGATTVSGVLSPTAPGIHTGALSFAPTGKLEVTLASVAASAVPSVFVTGAVAIDPSAAVNVNVQPGTAVPLGTSLALITNDAADPITGHFAGLPANAALTTRDGVSLLANYAGGDGNDFVLTAGNLPSPVGPPAPTGPATVSSSAYGASFTLTYPRACVAKGSKFSLILTVVKQSSGKSKRAVLTKVTKVLFAIDGKAAKTVRSAPFSAQLSVPATARSGHALKLRATAYFKLSRGKARTKSLTATVSVC